jgi:hypothetical protein
MEVKVITFRAPESLYEHLIRESHRISFEKNEDLTVSDLIREALEAAYPMTNDASLSIDGGDENGRAKKDRRRK